MKTLFTRKMLLAAMVSASLAVPGMVAAADVTDGATYRSSDYTVPARHYVNPYAELRREASMARSEALREQMDDYRAWRDQEHETWQRWVNPVGSFYRDRADARQDYHRWLSDQHREVAEQHHEWMRSLAPPAVPLAGYWW